ncbi:NtaA/DmoA family FMN-dependent monooxygenase [Nocardioides sp. zg-536]|uniref:NtaA/DmoA family FMN-dependent monooxygenase n=1 Tax=Nocardioides faecalis TaxID=2803858 RepID=A0A938Y0N3_9ACTN|nr:NtaA/DmoA family FMN-dependent monooxygenase [Nocardioides faecalis]MBM9459992.1 NtaA/DmoA family FMN-dependent monooxygenase [Nocardioides faecalis]QVI58787.1 NtaA/DmoA family FMN-dependent monooxygenase [Nocardioides faecalis]
MPRQMTLIGFYKIPTAHYTGMWRHPHSATNLLDPALPMHAAKVLEEGLFDMIFMSDGIVTPATFGDRFDETLRSGSQGALELEPSVVLSMMATATSRIGLGGTMSTTFMPPFHIARILGSLDVLSGGRAAWNIVTSHNDVQAQNFGSDTILPADQRYDRADEVTEAVTGLWSSWEADAVVVDKQTGVFVDPEKVHHVDYEGEHVKVRGPLSIPRSAQGRPVLMQAGSSNRGMEFGARWGEIIFVMGHTPEALHKQRAAMRAKVAELGRNPDDLKVAALVQPIIGETEAIAREKQEFIRSTVSVDAALAVLSAHTGIDLSAMPRDTAVSAIVDQLGGPGARGTAALLNQANDAGTDGITLEEAARKFGASGLTPQVVGTGEQVAEQLRELFDAEAADGFMIDPTEMPGTFESFTRAVVPHLQRMGVFRTAYAGETLRDVLGLPSVVS